MVGEGDGDGRDAVLPMNIAFLAQRGIETAEEAMDDGQGVAKKTCPCCGILKLGLVF
jgi:hypothetical protein